jgi:dienelactone hydrolase
MSKGACSIEVSHQKAPSDVAQDIRVIGCEPGKAIQLRLRGKDQAGADFESTATFVADSEGVIALNAQAPQSGAYSGVNPMGLFWSMNPVSKKTTRFVGSDIGTLTFTLATEASGKQLASTVIERIFWSPEGDVIRQSIEEEGLVGTLFYPSSGGPHAAVIVLGGSDGGLHEGSAALLAKHGYAALALAYFGIDPLPRELVEIPLEYCGNAISWLEGHEAVDRNRIAIMGWSKGGELAVLAAATFPEKIKATVGLSPSCVVWQGLSEGGRPLKKACWARRGESLQYLPLRVKLATLFRVIFRLEFSFVSSYRDSLNDQKAYEAARIPVEKINGPVLLLTGSDDALWPAAEMCERIVDTLAQHNHPCSYEHVSYRGAGHALRPPYLPSNKEQKRDKMLFGGSPEANVKACIDSWGRMLAFFQEHLQKPFGANSNAPSNVSDK